MAAQASPFVAIMRDYPHEGRKRFISALKEQAKCGVPSKVEMARRLNCSLSGLFRILHEHRDLHEALVKTQAATRLSSIGVGK